MAAQNSNTRDDAEAKALESRVWTLMREGDAKRAVAECEELNRRFPAYAPGWHSASHLLIRLNNPLAALTAIQRALSVNSTHAPWLLQKAICLSRLRRLEELTQTVHSISDCELRTAYQYSALAMLKTELGMREKAVVLYQQSIALQPNEARHYYNVACLQRSLGDLDVAEESFDNAVRLDPTDYESYKIRSDLRRQTTERNHVDELTGLLEKNVANDRGRVQLLYALAKEHEDLGSTEQSFACLKEGSDLRRSLMKYDVERDLETINTIRATFTTKIFEQKSTGHSSEEPVFILGMPRTGTTLAERIIATHSDVFAAGELNNFAAQLMSMIRAQNADSRPSRDEVVRSSVRLDFRSLGESYVDSTRPFTGKVARFIDKMPLNYLYVGLIHLALPNATIINLRRNPMDTIYAIYKQLFVDAYPFSYSIDELARYYVAYHELMQHWNDVLPDVVHTVHYENLVDDTEGEARALLDACGLDWQSQCLKFYENKEASTTASTAQIRRPVYKSSIGRWRDYEHQLQSAVQVLEAAGINPFK